MEYEYLWDEEVTNFLNENIGNIKSFEVYNGYYLKIHMNDGSYVEVKPEYGGIYFSHKMRGKKGK